MKKIADYFGVSVDYLMTGSDKKREERPNPFGDIKGIYLSYAKEAQDSGIDPDDIRPVSYTHLFTQKLLDRRDLLLRHGRQLPNLVNPGSLDELCRLLPLERRQAVGEPGFSQNRQKRALADSLRPRKDWHIVIFRCV